jgi:hypothetical protein
MCEHKNLDPKYYKIVEEPVLGIEYFCLDCKRYIRTYGNRFARIDGTWQEPIWHVVKDK